MTSKLWAWIEKETGMIKTVSATIEPEIVAWASKFLADITPVVKEAAQDAVLSAVTAPGDGNAKAAAALEAAKADLAGQGVTVAENDLKAAVQIAYKALPAEMVNSAAGAAVAGAADTAIDNAGAAVQKAAE